MKVTITTRSGRELIKGGLDLSDSATVTDLQEAIHKRKRMKTCMNSKPERMGELGKKKVKGTSNVHH